jgi:molecular chaperone GrpE
VTDQSMEDSVNTEAVNDEPTRAEVAPEQPGATAPAADAAADVPSPEAPEAPDAGTPDADGAAGREPGPGVGAVGAEADAVGAPGAVGEHPDTVLAAERLADLQRLSAEYVNYKRRVDRDRAVVQERAVRDVLESLLPVLDDIHAAREHGDLTGGPFAAIADKLEGTLGRYGLARFGAKGEEFDPQQHEALMHAPWPADDDELPSDASATTVVTVLQPGYRAGEQVLRPARVAVADPD